MRRSAESFARVTRCPHQRMGCVADLRSGVSNQIFGFPLGRLLEPKHGADAAVLEPCRGLSSSGFEEEALRLSLNPKRGNKTCTPSASHDTLCHRKIVPWATGA